MIHNRLPVSMMPTVHVSWSRFSPIVRRRFTGSRNEVRKACLWDRTVRRASLGTKRTPSWITVDTFGFGQDDRHLFKPHFLVISQRNAVCSTLHCRKAKLNMIVFPAANRTDVITSGWLTEDEKAATGAWIRRLDQVACHLLFLFFPSCHLPLPFRRVFPPRFLRLSLHEPKAAMNVSSREGSWRWPVSRHRSSYNA